MRYRSVLLLGLALLPLGPPGLASRRCPTELGAPGFWSLSFRIGLYDLFIPFNYDKSLQEAFRLLNPSVGHHVGDFGSGSGRLVIHALDWLRRGGKLTGWDVDPEGLRFARNRADELGVKGRAFFRWRDLTSSAAPPEELCDGGIAHFFLYTLPDPTDRYRALTATRVALKKGAHLVVSVPSEKYCVDTIISDALCLESQRDDINKAVFQFRQRVVYPLAHQAMLKIEAKMDLGEFQRFTQEQLVAELGHAGFTVEKIIPTYGGCGYHALVVK